MPIDSNPGASQPFELDARQLPNPPKTTTENERLLAALAYFSQLVVPLVLPLLLITNRNTRESSFVRQHAVQAIALVVAAVLYYLVALLVLLLLRSEAQALVIALALLLLPPAFVSLYYAVRAVTGNWTELPWLSDFLKDTGLL